MPQLDRSADIAPVPPATPADPPFRCCRAGDPHPLTPERFASLMNNGTRASIAGDLAAKHFYHQETPKSPDVLPCILSPGATLPSRAHSHDAGLDLYPLEPFTLAPNEVKVIPTGVRVAIPPGYFGKIEGRSGLAAKGIWAGGGVVDCEFRGEIGVILANVGQSYFASPTDADGNLKAIGQLIIQPVRLMTPMAVDRVGATARGENGFGSTDA